ncbi:peptidoglycan-binding protein [Marinobacter sp. HN1S83]|uniref:peptidoglycan-binding domain-containing protein n=1 Tax=Marinobacter sp. HN1S83 TaxID=3382301 RepID=UPI00387B9C01
MRIKTTNHRPLGAAIITAALTIAAVPAALANETVALKNALYGAGYDVSNVSGTMDDTTRSELRAFQRDQGLTVSGELDEATKSALGMVPMEVAANAAPASGSANATADTGESRASEARSESEQEDAVEEDDDGGWSLF